MIITEKDDFLAMKGMMREGAYNALDVVGTFAVHDALAPMLTGNKARIYAFERGMQAAAFDMMVRGVRINDTKRKAAVVKLKRTLTRVSREANKLPVVQEFWDKTKHETGWCPAEPGKHHKWPRGVADTQEKVCLTCGVSRVKRLDFNCNSSVHCKHLLYKRLKMMPVHNKKGEVTTDDEALAKLGQKYPEHIALIEAILTVRDTKKQLGLLEARLTPDNRFPSSFNVGAAWTGRWSSSKNPFGEGGNLQNIGEQHRYLFEADPGYEIFYADLEQAESNSVAHLAGDPRYIEAHLLGDVHTYVSRLVFPFLPFTGDLKEDKKVAKVNPPWDLAEGHDYRFQSKRVQHGSNYGLTPPGIAMIAHIPLKESKVMQANYFGEFPYIQQWQNSVIAKIRMGEPLVSPFGFEIMLMGRPWDRATHRQGFSAIPQSIVAHVISIGIHRLYKTRKETGIQLLAQVHDAILGQYPIERREESIAIIKEAMRVPLPIGDRVMTIATEVAAGKNWGKRSEENPDGIVVV